MGWGRGDRPAPALRLCSRFGGAVVAVTVAAALSGCALRAGHQADARETQQHLLAAARCACSYPPSEQISKGSLRETGEMGEVGK